MTSTIQMTLVMEWKEQTDMKNKCMITWIFGLIKVPQKINKDISNLTQEKCQCLVCHNIQIL